MTATFLSTDDPRWTRALELGEHDVYHLPEYVDVAAKREGCEPTAFYAESREGLILIPLIVRRLPNRLGAPRTWRDATSPYGYGGPVVSRGCTHSGVAGFLTSLVDLCQRKEIISVFVRTHPLIPFPGNAVGEYGAVVHEGDTVTVDLGLSESVIRGEMEHGHQQRIKKLEREGFFARIDEWSHFAEFISLYRETMRRVDAGEYYDFPTTYFHDLKRALGDRLHLCTVHSPAGEPASAGLFTRHNGIVQFHLSGSARQHRHMSPSKLMLSEMIMWAKSHGDRVVHLGGGVGAKRDSLFAFKAGFSKNRTRFETIRIVTDGRRYSYLSNLDRTRSHASSTTSFFPRYRPSLHPTSKVRQEPRDTLIPS